MIQEVNPLILPFDHFYQKKSQEIKEKKLELVLPITMISMETTLTIQTILMEGAMVDLAEDNKLKNSDNTEKEIVLTSTPTLQIPPYQIIEINWENLTYIRMSN